MKLGEILIADRLVQPADVERALNLQQRQTRRARLGSILWATGMATADDISRALSRQLTVPAALDKHLSARNAALATLIPTELAVRFGALPIARGRDQSLVICMREPTSREAILAIEKHLGARFVAAVACDAMLMSLIHHAYGLPMPFTAVEGSGRATSSSGIDIDLDFDDSEPVHVIAAPPLPAHSIDANTDVFSTGRFTLVGLDDEGVVRDPSQHDPALMASRTSTASSERPSMRMMAASARTTTGKMAPATPEISVARTVSENGINRAALSAAAARIAAENDIDLPLPVAPLAAASYPGSFAPTTPPAVASPAVAIDLAEVIDRLTHATSRDEISDSVVAFTRTHCAAAISLIIRDGLALGQSGFGPALSQPAIEAISLPLSLPSIVRTAVDSVQPFAGTLSEGSALQERFVRLFGGGREFVVAPIVIGSRVVSVLVGAAPPGVSAAKLFSQLQPIVPAMQAAYLRLILDAKADNK